MTVYAPAKINLGLHVMPLRGDGYHNLASIFTTVGLCDEITVNLTENKNTCVVDCGNMVLPLENTFTAAYKAFCVLSGCDAGCYVKVTKRIPSGGGLGGGSSDASSFIQSMDILCGTHLSDEALTSIAGKVGSDVYFFTSALLKDPSGQKPFAAYVAGRGEFIQPVQCRNDYSVLLVFPEVSVSTKEAYRLVDEHMDKVPVPSKDELVAEYRKPVDQWKFHNSFTEPVCSVYERVADALKALKKSGAAFADMSGSGSTVYGIFQTRDQALAAQNKLKLHWKSVVV